MNYVIIYIGKENNTKKNYGGNKMLTKIKEIVTEEEIKELDRVIADIYGVEYDNNHSTAYNLGFDTVANHNGSGYENLVIIADSLNDGEEDEYFARYILSQVLPSDKIEILKKELLTNRNRYISILYL